MMMQLVNFFADGAEVDCLKQGKCDTGLPTIAADNAHLQVILQYVFGVLGAVAVIIVIVGALRFVNARGNPQDAAGARQTVIYALIGLAVCLSAEAIVTFVLRSAL